MKPIDRVRQRRLMSLARTEVIAHSESFAGTDHALLVKQLRSILAAVQTPVDRLAAPYLKLAPGPEGARLDRGSVGRCGHADVGGHVLR